MKGALEDSVEIDGDAGLAGTAHQIQRGRALSTVFVYEPGHLAQKDAYPSDPELPRYRGQWTVSGPVGAFSDCAPDRWGRNLIAKRLRARARRERKTPPTIIKFA